MIEKPKEGTTPTELRLIAELMKNSRRSDRQISKALGISQPTVSRLMKKLEKQGMIKEYTAIPDFGKLGFKVMALTFVKNKPLSGKELEEARKAAANFLAGDTACEMIMVERGIGLDFDGAIISYHLDYSSYRKMLDWIRQFSFIDFDSIQSFLIDLEDQIHYRTLTLQTLAKDISALAETEKK